MAQLFGLSAEQVARIRPSFPKERGVKWVDDRKVLSGITHVIQKGLRWVDAPAPTKPSTTVAAAGETRGFELIFSESSVSDSAEPPDAPEPAVLIIDATDIKAHRTASSLSKGGVPPLDWWHQGGHDQQAPWGLQQQRWSPAAPPA